MLREVLEAMERRCVAEAPALLPEVRRALALLAGMEGPTLSHGSLTGLSFVEDEGTTEQPTVATLRTGHDRYVDLGRIAVGGMGEVRRVRDRALNRAVAMKLLRLDIIVSPSALARFVEEAQTTAQLQHPGIVPVYDAGNLDDGRAFFTMKEVRGRTFSQVIASVHGPGGDPEGWTVRRLVGALHAAAQAVAFAHERGVIHRDLKPANIMVGDLGEVQVMDWGITKLLGRAEVPGDDDVIRGSRDATLAGSVLGTPAYMAPEQAAGDVHAVDTRADTYALGAVLYEVLCGAPPYEGPTGFDILVAVLAGPPRWPWTEPPAGLEELVRVCDRAMARDAARRHPTAREFADALGDWLDGTRRREAALEVVGRAEPLVAEAASLRARAAELSAAAAAELAAVPAWEGEERKLEAWARQDEAAALERLAAQRLLQRDQLLAAALVQAPELPEAHAALAEDQRARHAAAEEARDPDGAARAELLLRAHVDALPEEDPVRQRCLTYLSGVGALTLLTDPPDAEVELFRYEPHGRRLVARPVRALGRTPLIEVPLEMGSYLCVVRRPGRAEVRYPVRIDRGAHWDGVPPGERAPAPIVLPRADELGPDDVYVPAGWFLAGTRQLVYGAYAPRPLWADAMVVRRFQVTNREYLAFLDDLVAAGREPDALRWAPRDRGATGATLERVLFDRGPDGRFLLARDEDGDTWEPDWPTFCVDWASAGAYAAWLAARTGQPWRLPWDLEWEKASRGVDGRSMPWGDGFDPSFCNMRDSRGERQNPAVVDSFPFDCSVYGIRGFGGNVQDWCQDVWTKAGADTPGGRIALVDGPTDPIAPVMRVHRGGYWHGYAGFGRCAYRNAQDAQSCLTSIGFRVARSYPG